MQDILDMHLGLQGELQRLELEQEQIDEGIIEAKRRIGILDEAMAWYPVEVDPFPEDAFPTGQAVGQRYRVESAPA